jgi:hypothetical protein
LQQQLEEFERRGGRSEPISEVGKWFVEEGEEEVVAVPGVAEVAAPSKRLSKSQKKAAKRRFRQQLKEQEMQMMEEECRRQHEMVVAEQEYEAACVEDEERRDEMRRDKERQILMMKDAVEEMQKRGVRKWEGDEGIGEALQARVAEALTERGMMEGGYDPLSPQIVAVVHDVVMKEKKKRGVWNGNERRWLDELTADVEAMAAWARLERGDRGMRKAASVQDEYEEVDGYAEGD